MLALLSIIVALTLLGLTVYALHRHQTIEVEYNVDRSLPLPPLEPNSAARLRKPDSPRTPSGSPDRDSSLARQGPVDPQGDGTVTWQETVTRLKNEAQFAAAYAICTQHFPLWGAYNQYCMLLRTELKAPKLDPERRGQHLTALYRTAAIAELLHDKSPDSTKLSNAQLRELDLEAVATLPYPYAEIGYAHLRLIRKGDIKQLVDAWGRPQAHLPPRVHHAEWWARHTSR